MEAVNDAPSALERLISRDRLLVGAGLVAMVSLAWIYLLRTSRSMGTMPMAGMSMPMDMRQMAGMEMSGAMLQMRTWNSTDFLMLFVMWAVMMVAMMLPSAAPVILLVLASYRRRASDRARAAAISFVGGYLIAWTGFSAVAAAMQLGLHRAALLSSEMAMASTLGGGVLLIVAGAYQWSPLKTVCLSHCRSPLGFLTRYWREGPRGGFALGLRHGVFCVGCCWALMALLFVAGVMNLLWVAAIATLVLLEKLVPAGARLGRVAGSLLVAAGLYLLTRA
jgi:predicted metal-binding membrane protein